MTFDWLTALLLEPLLEQRGLGLTDLASSLHAATRGTSETVRTRRAGASIALAEFTTAQDRPGGRLVDLAAGAWDPFASPSAAAASAKPGLGRLPAIWGGVAAEGGALYLLPAGIALHPSLIALPTAGGGMMLFRAELPAAIAGSAPGRPFTDLVSHPVTDGAGLVVRRTRPAADGEMAHLREVGGDQTPSAATAWDGPAMVATFRNAKTPRRIDFRD